MENSEEIFDLAQKLNEKGVRVRVGKHRFPPVDRQRRARDEFASFRGQEKTSAANVARHAPAVDWNAGLCNLIIILFSTIIKFLNG